MLVSLMPRPSLAQLEQLLLETRTKQINDIVNSINNSIAGSASITGQSATGMQELDLRAIPNTGVAFGEPAWTMSPSQRFSFGATYLFLNFTEFEGDDIEDVLGTVATDEENVASDDEDYELLSSTVIGGKIDEIEVHVLNLSGTVKLFKDLDLSVIVPIIDVGGIEGTVFSQDRLRLVPVGDDDPDRVITFLNSGGANQDISKELDVPGGDTGIGDILLRLKYGVLRERDGNHPLTLSLGYDLKTPTGDEDEMLGSGEVDHRFRCIAGKALWGGRVYPTAELAYLISGTDADDDYDAFEYQLAVPAVLKQWLEDPTDDASQTKASLTIGPTLAGRISDAADQLDAGVSARLAWRRNLVFQAGVKFAVQDDEGAVSPWAPTVGFEYRF